MHMFTTFSPTSKFCYIPPLVQVIFHQTEFQDTEMEVLYHVESDFEGVSPYTALT